MLEDSRLFDGVFFGFLNSYVCFVFFCWLFCCVLFLSHKVIGIKFTTEKYRNFLGRIIQKGFPQALQ